MTDEWEHLFSSQDFSEAWDSWQQHRAEIKKRLTPTTIRFQLRRLSRMGVERAIRALEFSMENGYMGIFEPREEPMSHGPRRATEGPSIQDRVANRLNGLFEENDQ